MAVSVLFLAIGLVGCGGPGGGDAAAAGEPDSLDFEGQWAVTYDCGEDGEGNFTVTIIVNGTTATGAGNEPGVGDFNFDNGVIDRGTLTWTTDYLNSPGDGGRQEARYTLTSATTFEKTSTGWDALNEIAWSCTGDGTKE
jgi:hypothetical protein